MRIKDSMTRELFWLVSVFCLNSAILIQDGRFDPDPHHDGLIFSGAVAASQGLIPNRDFFSQYGPLAPFLQGFFFDITSSSLLNLRILMGLLSALNGTVIYFVFSKFASRSLAVTLSLIWVLQLSARIPWPSILSTSLILMSLILMLNIEKNSVTVSDQKLRLIIAGFLLGILSFVRIHNLAFLILILIFLVTKKSQTLSYLKHLLVGNLLGLTFGLISLFLMGGLSQYIQQCIIWPIFKYGTVEINKSYVVGIFWFPFISLLSFLYFWIAINFIKFNSWKIPVFVVLVLIVLWTSIGLSYFFPREGYLSLKNPLVLFIDSSNNFVHFIGFFSVGISLLFAIKTLLSREVIGLNVLLAIISFGTLTQLYPLYDQVHLWFISPVLVVCGSLFLRETIELKFNSRFLVTFLMPFVIVLGALSIHNWSKDYVNFESKILFGMKGNPNAVKQIDSTLEMLNSYAKEKSILFDCNNGLYSAFDGSYHSVDRNYVNWAPGFSPAKPGQEYFVCDVSSKDYILKLETSSQIAYVKYSYSGGDYYNAILIRN